MAASLFEIGGIEEEQQNRQPRNQVDHVFHGVFPNSSEDMV